MKNIQTIICAGLLAIGLSAQAGLQVQLSGGTNNFNTTTNGLTNVYAVYGDTTVLTNGVLVGTTGNNSYIDCSKASYVNLTWTFLAINTNSAAGTITFRDAGSVDLAGWTNNYVTQTYVVAASSTNYVTLIQKVTNPAPGIALRSVEMPNTASATIILTNLAHKGYVPTGI
jgi:hypothetical protein